MKHAYTSRFAVVAASVVLATSALADEPKTIERDPGEVSQLAIEVSQEIFSPFCPVKTLAMCPSPNAAEVRRDIQDMAQQGMTKESIKESVIATYGEDFRLKKPPASDNIGLLIALIIGLAIALVAIAYFSRRRRDDGGESHPKTKAHDVPSNGALPHDGVDGDLDDEERDYLDALRKEYRD